MEKKLTRDMHNMAGDEKDILGNIEDVPDEK